MSFDYRDVLLKASESIVEPGRWIQDSYSNRCSYYQEVEATAGCAAWHIDNAIEALFGHWGPDAYSLSMDARDALSFAVGNDYSTFNDSAESAHQVAEAMRKAATT